MVDTMNDISRETVVILLIAAIILSFISIYTAFSNGGQQLVRNILKNGYGTGTVSVYVRGAPIEAAGLTGTVNVAVVNDQMEGI